MPMVTQQEYLQLQPPFKKKKSLGNLALRKLYPPLPQGCQLGKGESLNGTNITENTVALSATFLQLTSPRLSYQESISQEAQNFTGLESNLQLQSKHCYVTSLLLAPGHTAHLHATVHPWGIIACLSLYTSLTKVKAN